MMHRCIVSTLNQALNSPFGGSRGKRKSQIRKTHQGRTTRIERTNGAISASSANDLGREREREESGSEGRG
jgi:hypothetical protein